MKSVVQLHRIRSGSSSWPKALGLRAALLPLSAKQPCCELAFANRHSDTRNGISHPSKVPTTKSRTAGLSRRKRQQGFRSPRSFAHRRFRQKAHTTSLPLQKISALSEISGLTASGKELAKALARGPWTVEIGKEKCCQGIPGKPGQTTVASIKTWRVSPAEPPRPLTAPPANTTPPPRATKIFCYLETSIHRT